MTVRFLLFSGNWAHEGNFYLLETEKSILVLAAGQSFFRPRLAEQQVGRDYLKENKTKVKAIIINNTSFQNIGWLENLCSDLGPSIPIYTSFYSQLVLKWTFSSLRNEIEVVKKNQSLKIEEWELSFLPLNSYLLGNLVLAVHHSQFSFYFLEGLMLNSLSNNNLLFSPHFLTDFQQFLTTKKKSTYLITSGQGLHWGTKNSLWFATKFFPWKEKSLFFILYEFDWLHILELLELGQKWGKKIQILDENFASLVNQVLAKSSLRTVIQAEDKKKSGEKIYLLTGNPADLEEKLKSYLTAFSPVSKTNFHFLVGLPPATGGEEKLARIIDYLWTQSGEVTNLSKTEYLTSGTSFFDLKLLFQLLQPTGVILLQNSYKNEPFFSNLSTQFLMLGNGHFLDFPTRQTSLLKVKKPLIDLAELLVEQREEIGENGFLIILLLAKWTPKEFQLKGLRIEPLALTSTLNIPKLENKIKSWWETDLVKGIEKTGSAKIIKETVKRRLNEKLKSYLNSEHEMVLEEALVLLFDR